MTKEELKALGLNDKQISEVFKLNGVAVNNAKGDLATKETELETKDTEIKTLQRQLETANKEIESFKKLPRPFAQVPTPSPSITIKF